MTHLGQRLSALIDGELDLDERERVLVHMARCGSCRDEVAALRMLKRRMNALGEAAAGAALTGRLMSLRDSAIHDGMLPVEAMWPPPAEGDWQTSGASTRHGHDDSDNRAARFFIAGSLAVFSGWTEHRGRRCWRRTAGASACAAGPTVAWMFSWFLSTALTVARFRRVTGSARTSPKSGLPASADRPRSR